jgi:homoserine O-succinyltransferase
MPVHVDSSSSSRGRKGSTASIRKKSPSQSAERSSQCVTIGLVNNMPDAAFEATERQFVSLLESASENIPICLSLYTLPGIPRTESVGNLAARGYSSVDVLWDTNLDGLIVTGKEPLTADLRDETCWESFTKILDWARDNTHSAVWSCLAAHAAVLHMDGISRRKSNDKHFGILECAHVSDHQLTAGTPSRFHIPHSRWNGVSEEELAARGYSVLSRTAGAGVDTFIKEENSLFVFFQGHPEYESDTLLREYRRDVGRYLRRESETYPLLPRGYFDASTESALTDLREKAMTGRSEELVASVAAALETKKVKNTWVRTASRIYGNWLEYILARKNESRRDGNANVA